MCGTNNKIKIECTEEEEKATVTCKNLYTVLKNENLYHIKEKFKTTYDVLNSLNSNFKQIELRKEFKKDGAIIYNSEGKPIMVIDIHTGDTIKVPITISKIEVKEVKEVKEGEEGEEGEKSKSSSCAPWMDIVWKEYKTFINKRAGSGTYVTDPKLNARAKEYHDYVHGSNNKQTGQTEPWCASFVSWNLKQVNILDNPKTASSQAFANHSSLKIIDKPAYGAIAVFRDFVYVGHSANEDFSVNGKMVSLKEGNIEYVQTNDFVTSIKKDGEIIFKANGSGHVNFVVSLVKGKEKSLVNCLGGNQDGGCISKKTYIYGKNQLVIAYGKTYRMSMGFFIPKFSTKCPDELLRRDKSYGFSTTDR
jgi:hypothetical protein